MVRFVAAKELKEHKRTNLNSLRSFCSFVAKVFLNCLGKLTASSRIANKSGRLESEKWEQPPFKARLMTTSSMNFMGKRWRFRFAGITTNVLILPPP